MKTTTNTAQFRAEYRNALKGLIYDNASREAVKLAVERALFDAGIDPDGAKPATFVKAIKGLRLTCRRCCGTGRFITGTLNGVPTGPGGNCFRCGGSGSQDHNDGHRNRVHGNHYCPGIS